MQRIFTLLLLLQLPLCALAGQPQNLTYTISGQGNVLLNWEHSADSEPVLHFHESFEGLNNSTFPPAGWANVDNDGDGKSWILFDVPYSPNLNPYPAYDGEYAAASYSWFDGQVLTPDNWLITPAITIPANGLLQWAVAAQRPNYSQEHYKVYFSATGNAPSDFEILLHEETLPAQDITWKVRQSDLSQYAGQQGYVAFVHTQTTDLFAIKLDDIRVYEMPSGVFNGFRVYRNATLIAEIEQIQTTSYLDAGLTPGVYEYTVSAVYGDQETEPSNSVWVTIEAPQIDYAPQNLTIAVDETHSKWVLSWEAPDLNNIFLWEDFEEVTDANFPPPGWQNIDNDGGGMAWIVFDVPYNETVNPYPAYSGNQAIASYSWFNGNTYQPDNWIITPPVQLGKNSMLSWAVAAQRPNYSQEHYKVFLSTQGNSIENFTELLWEETLPEQDITWKLREVDLSVYDGQVVNIAFVHTETTDLFAVKLDAILLQGNANLTHTGYQVFQNDELIAHINDPEALELIIDIPSSNGLYTFYAKTVFAEGVSVRSNEVSKEVQGLGVEKVNQAGIVVYPNPGKEVFHVRATEPVSGASVRVISMTNQIVYHVQGIDLSETQQHRIELPNLPKGVYMIAITTADYQQSFKVIVQ